MSYLPGFRPPEASLAHSADQDLLWRGLSEKNSIIMLKNVL